MKSMAGIRSSITVTSLLTLSALTCMTVSIRPTATVLPPTPRPEPTSTPDCHRYDYLQEFDKEASCYEAWSAAEPGNFEVWSALGRIYANQHRYEEALDAEFTALELTTDPDDKGWTYVGIGVDYYNLERYAGAIDYLQRGLNVPGIDGTTEAQLLVWLGRAYEADGQLEFACSRYREALEAAQQAGYEWAVNQANKGISRCQ